LVTTEGPGDELRLLGRRRECAALERVLADARGGASRVMVVRGEAGAGKTALLAHLSGRADGWRVARAVGVEAEVELAHSGIHQLCGPMLDDHLDRLPDPQRAALEVVFGRSAGPPPDRFMVGLATLTLLAEAAERQPLLCIVDDAQWLDEASLGLLAFVARRLLAERIAIVCAVRTGAAGGVLTGLPELPVAGLGDRDARALLLDHVTGPLDDAVCDQIITESRGNPLALMELPRTWNVADLAGGFGLPAGQAAAGRVETSYARRLQRLPPDTRLLVLAAAAEPVGDPVLLYRAAQALGLPVSAADPAADAGLLDVRGRVEFAHPLVRSAAYRSASTDDRHRVHRALAEATDPDTDPDRRAWHRARATLGPDEGVAADLEGSAGRAQARGGLAAAAAFLERAAALTPDPARRADRALAAAEAKHLAGAPEAATRLLSLARAGPLGELGEARAQLLGARIAFTTTRGREAPPLLLDAARRMAPLDPALARETYLDAFAAAIFAGRMVQSGDVREIAAAVLAARWDDITGDGPRARDLLLDGLAHLAAHGYAAGIPRMRRAVEAFTAEPMTDGEALRWLWLARHSARTLGDDARWDELTARGVDVARRSGALSMLPAALHERFRVELYGGDLAAATALAEEAGATIEAIGGHERPHGALVLAAWRGRVDEAVALVDAGRDEVAQRGEGMWLIGSQWTLAELFNGLGRWEEAFLAAEWVAARPDELGSSVWISAELVEAAARSGHPDRAAAALARFTELAHASGTDWAMGVEARSRALLADGAEAESAYRVAIARLARTRLRVMLARTHLVYGEWLRREGRRVDARAELRAAHGMFEEMGNAPYAERARRELVATGEKVRRRTAESRDTLTPQEEQIARLAADGLSNPEIGARLFISARTVEWHLRKVFTKLGITSRRRLRAALAAHAPRAPGG
jgi:DNA-binding CsgD family transcriptional regulator